MPGAVLFIPAFCIDDLKPLSTRRTPQRVIDIIALRDKGEHESRHAALVRSLLHLFQVNNTTVGPAKKQVRGPS